MAHRGSPCTPSRPPPSIAAKKSIYERVLKIGEYFLFDPHTAEFEGFTLDAARGVYVAKEPDSKGRLRCEQLGLWLGTLRGMHYSVEAEWLRWIDEQDRPLATPWEHAHTRHRREPWRLRLRLRERELQELKAKSEA